ncbi:MAG: DNA alkylation repair protein [Bacilli bacterium]|nr:DNA alkylation repair protein [Bacilli bacterium]
MNARQVKELLLGKAEAEYKEYSTKLSGSDFPILGVRRPVVKEIAESLIDDPEYKLEEVDLNDSVEVTMVYLIVGLRRLSDPVEQLNFMVDNVRHAVTWELTDTCPQHMGTPSFEVWKEYFDKMYKSKDPWARRFAWVYSTKYRQDKKVLTLFPLIKQDKFYYVLMGQAWFLSNVAISFPDEVLDLLHNGKCGKKLVYRTVSKMCSSTHVLERVKRKAKMFRD